MMMRDRLKGIVDYFVFNDRPIAQRVDDSVVTDEGRDKGSSPFARICPEPFQLPEGFEECPDIFAFGGELKNTFCLTRSGEAIVSQHIGDLEDAATQADYRHNIDLYKTLYRHKAEAMVCDLHPEYISSKIAKDVSETSGIPLIEVQHHHAHIAACMAENGLALDAKPVIGVALDGLARDDGTFWGGEFLLADYRGYKRIETFKPVAMIGGEQAIKEPWRNTYAHLQAEMGWAKFAINYSGLDLFRFLDQKPRELLDGMVARGVNSLWQVRADGFLTPLPPVSELQKSTHFMKARVRSNLKLLLTRKLFARRMNSLHTHLRYRG